MEHITYPARTPALRLRHIRLIGLFCSSMYRLVQSIMVYHESTWFVYKICFGKAKKISQRQKPFLLFQNSILLSAKPLTYVKLSFGKHKNFFVCLRRL
jgi:hypothetical protein